MFQEHFHQISEGTMHRYNFDLCIKGITYPLQCGERFNHMTIQQPRYSGLFGNHKITILEHVGRRHGYKLIAPGLSLAVIVNIGLAAV